MKLHLLALPHTQVAESFLSCAYTQKVAKFCKMMGNSYPIILYAGADVSGTSGYAEHVECISEGERTFHFGPGFNTVSTPLVWDSNMSYWQLFASRAIPALQARAQTRDLLLIIGGNAQKPISDAVPLLYPVEWGVGYEGIYTNACAFESYSWMHHVYGLNKWRNGRAYDQVIPNYFDPADFLPVNDNPDSYLLYLGRVTVRKGPHIAGQIAARLGMKLLIAGPGGSQKALGPIQGDGCTIEGNVRYLGEITSKHERAQLLRNAACVLMPTLYVEPFGGVAIEAMMAGCPVVASDWGAFTETINHQVGRRFRTLQQGCQAVIEAMGLDRQRIADYANRNFSLDAVRPMYAEWFGQIETLWGEGWAA